MCLVLCVCVFVVYLCVMYVFLFVVCYMSMSAFSLMLVSTKLLVVFVDVFSLFCCLSAWSFPDLPLVLNTGHLP